MKTDFSLGPFIALETKSEDRESLQSLTTQVMHWEADIWILDLSRFKGYWQRRAAAAGVKVGALWRRILSRLNGEAPETVETKVTDISPACRAACADNPWLAVLMLYRLREKGISGLIFESSRFGRSLRRDISWENWWRGVDVIEGHFQAVRPPGFKPAGFRSQCRRLRLAVPRLGFRRPGEMHILNAGGVRRRFGKEIADLWGWTCDRGLEGAESLRQGGFPWRDHLFREPPVAERCLDYPVDLWEQMSPLLKEDLDQLCHCLGNSGEQVIRLDWHLTLADMSVLPVIIRFRHPHPLPGEKGEHRTALLQAGYAFADAAREKYPPPAEADTPIETPPVISWRLLLVETLVLPNVVLDIFGNRTERNSDIETLLQLENELPVPLNRFLPREDWLPEASYGTGDLTGSVPAFSDSALDRSLAAVAESRPLYIRSRPLPLSAVRRESAGRFLESTTGKWWRRGENGAGERTYFKHIDAEGNATWIFRDSTGQWYQHGIFG